VDADEAYLYLTCVTRDLFANRLNKESRQDERD